MMRFCALLHRHSAFQCSHLLSFVSRRCDSIRRDVLEDEYTRGTAFTLDPVEKEVDDEEYLLEDEERDSDERYEESNATREVTGKKNKRKKRKVQIMNVQTEPFFRSIVEGLQG